MLSNFLSEGQLLINRLLVTRNAKEVSHVKFEIPEWNLFWLIPLKTWNMIYLIFDLVYIYPIKVNHKHIKTTTSGTFLVSLLLTFNSYLSHEKCHHWPVSFPFYTHCKHPKTRGLVIFPGVKETKHWSEIGD